MLARVGRLVQTQQAGETFRSALFDGYIRTNSAALKCSGVTFGADARTYMYT